MICTVMKHETCPDCGGKGTVAVEYYIDGIKTDKYVKGFPCMKCKTRGHVLIEQYDYTIIDLKRKDTNE